MEHSINILGRASSSNIKNLASNEIFVFGSNLSGSHGKGTAKLAYDKFGAEYHNYIGLQGQSYAIPTVNASITDKLNLSTISHVIKELFIYTVNSYPDKNFLVTEIGCGLAGWKVKDIAPLFRPYKDIRNLYLPQRFIDFLEKGE